MENLGLLSIIESVLGKLKYGYLVQKEFGQAGIHAMPLPNCSTWLVVRSRLVCLLNG